ncbi:MAG: NAD(P)/FAD-dependent oxidoreductase [Bacilli bacterium]|nr:NAD(P)/FAD-dependent oxidoreductase [Bacilli bacterium]
MKKTNYDIVVIGAGVIGCNIARELSQYELSVLVLEKDNDVCARASMANSAIVHSGYDPVPGTLKARFNVAGNKMFDELCKRLCVEFYRIGSLTIAMNDEQMKTLMSLKERAKENGVEVKILNHDELLKIEPNINPSAAGALLAPTAGIVDPFTFCAHNIENALDNGVILHLNEAASNVIDNGDHFLVKTEKDTYQAKIVINAAGHGSYKLASQLEKLDYEINPRKGEYFVFDHYTVGLVNHTIFPLPSAKGKGILVSPTYSGNYLVGPSSELSEAEDHSTDPATLAMVKAGALEMVPSLPFNELIRVFAGVRATPSDHDFHIAPLKTHPKFIHLCGIESPGFVSSPAIALYVVNELVKPLINLKKKNNYIPNIRPSLVTRKMDNVARAKLVKEHPEYGEIICQCEKISKGEILDAMSRSDHPHTIKAIKKRCRAGFGKCQGGFCQPLVAKMISEYYHIPLNEVLYSKIGSNVVRYKTKGEK